MISLRKRSLVGVTNSNSFQNTCKSVTNRNNIAIEIEIPFEFDLPFFSRFNPIPSLWIKYIV